MISVRCGDDPPYPGTAALEPVEVNNAPTDLKRADRRVIFVLHHDIYAGARLKQRPSILRSWRYAGAHHRNDALKLGEGKHHATRRRLICGSLISPPSRPVAASQACKEPISWSKKASARRGRHLAGGLSSFS